MPPAQSTRSSSMNWALRSRSSQQMKRNTETTTESDRQTSAAEPDLNARQPLAWHHSSVLPKQVQEAQAAAETKAQAEALQVPPRQNDVLLEILDWLRYILSAILIGLLLVVFVIQRNAVVGDSMDPTLHPNDQVLVEKVSKLWHGIAYGDIVTIRTRDLPQHEDGPNIIKRVIGLPGDTIELQDGMVYRNGELLAESYLPAKTATEVRNPDYAKVTLGPDEYFVMGDNRSVSLDSRSIGPIPVDHMIGEVLLRFYPWSDFGQP
ncbi:MAG: signal peptidase I [Clostridia bacterium]|nr:signal peptidase I [Clostridia bacterium]NCC76334.1 signal peptidase I [Clostridia bacterium]